MKRTYLALNWIFGTLFFLMGLLSLTESFLAGLSLIIASLFLLPPVKKFAYLKTNKEMHINVKIASVSIFFIAFLAFAGLDAGQDEKKLAAQQVREREERVQKDIDYFNANREQIILSSRGSLLNKEYKLAVSQSAKYLASGDNELNEIHSSAKKHLDEARKIEKTKKLLAQLKTTPSREYSKNRRLYQSLVKLHPDNELYKNKADFYSNKVEEEKQRQIRDVARKKRIKNQFSQWDGSHYNLERLIKKAMNDPDSYKHDETSYWDKGSYIIVQTSYRGKNAFGGIVRNFVKAKVNLDGEIIKILDES